MASLPQISIALLGASCSSSNKNFNTRPCIAPLYKNKHFSNLVAKPTLFPLRKQCQNEKWKTCGSDDGSCGMVPEFLPLPSREEAVRDFYKAFNEKNIERLKQLLSPKCVYQDLLFYNAYQDIEGVVEFLQSMMDAMGPNIHVYIEDVKESNHHMATAFWHLGWKNKKIPFTNGCGFFTFEEVEGKLFISKITGLEELPVKPGELLLKMLKAIRTLLDSYPLAAAMLDSHASEGDGTHGGIQDLFRRKN